MWYGTLNYDMAAQSLEPRYLWLSASAIDTLLQVIGMLYAASEFTSDSVFKYYLAPRIKAVLQGLLIRA
jgi:hypothetical protein